MNSSHNVYTYKKISYFQSSSEQQNIEFQVDFNKIFLMRLIYSCFSTKENWKIEKTWEFNLKVFISERKGIAIVILKKNKFKLRFSTDLNVSWAQEKQPVSMYICLSVCMWSPDLRNYSNADFCFRRTPSICCQRVTSALILWVFNKLHSGSQYADLCLRLRTSSKFKALHFIYW